MASGSPLSLGFDKGQADLLVSGLLLALRSALSAGIGTRGVRFVWSKAVLEDEETRRKPSPCKACLPSLPSEGRHKGFPAE